MIKHPGKRFSSRRSMGMGRNFNRSKRKKISSMKMNNDDFTIQNQHKNLQNS